MILAYLLLDKGIKLREAAMTHLTDIAVPERAEPHGAVVAPDTEAVAPDPATERQVVGQFARILRLQAAMLAREGQTGYADALRARAAETEQAVGLR